MREVQALDHQAKAHMEEAFRLTLEEKDEKISVMQMQVGGTESRGWGGGPPLSSKPEGTAPFGLLKSSKVSLCSGLKAKCLLYLLKYFTG